MASARVWGPIISTLLRWLRIVWCGEKWHHEVGELDPAQWSAILAHPSVDVNPSDGLGQTPLHIASFCGLTPCAQLLISHPQIDVNKKVCQYGTTPLHAACLRINFIGCDHSPSFTPIHRNQSTRQLWPVTASPFCFTLRPRVHHKASSFSSSWDRCEPPRSTQSHSSSHLAVQRDYPDVAEALVHHHLASNMSTC